MQKLPHRIFVRQLLLFGFDMYPQSVVFFVRDSGCAVRPAHTPQIKKKLPQTMQGLHKTVFAKAPAMGKIWRDFGHA
ncbi:hypothetical protein, partial [Faecalibacterium prausnitzii]|uniref:hypothetical protein n=1 Tax=Faecalibacterium prausnitzii TaxID=853 RepID=UPI0019D58D99